MPCTLRLLNLNYKKIKPTVFCFQGSESVVFCATDYSIEGKTGKFYRDCQEYTSNYPFDKDVEVKLWEVSEAVVAARQPL